MDMIFFRYRYFLSLIAPISIYLSLLLEGIGSATSFFVLFMMIPLAELFLSGSKLNLNSEQEQKVKEDHFFDYLLYINVPLQLAFLFYYLFLIRFIELSVCEYFFKSFAMATSCGVLAINVAHELGHRNTWYEKLMAKLLLSTSLYMHFYIEHNKGHHRHVSTDQDPASAKYKENVYRFIILSIKGTWLSAWNISVKEVIKKGGGAFSWKNQFLRFLSWEFLLTFIIWTTFDWQGLLAFVLVALGGIIHLEVINYIEHYGLRRELLENGRYEKTTPQHSWNSNHSLSRAVLFELSRHSDHHAYVNRKYQILRNFDESPQMPTGYPGMMLLSLIPILFFKVMDRQMRKFKIAIPSLDSGANYKDKELAPR